MTPAREVLTLNGVRLQRGVREILCGVTLDVAKGELLALMGPSGSGKTTILRAVAALDLFQTGRITVDDVTLEGGRAAGGDTIRRLRKRVGMVFQFHCLFEHLTALQNVCLAPVHAHGVAPADAARRAHELLAAFGETAAE